MLSLPLPIIEFLLCAVFCALVWRVDVGSRLARYFFTAFFGSVALAALMVGLRFGYDFENIIVVQRIIPLFIGPLVYLGFLSLMHAPAQMRIYIAINLGIATTASLLPFLFPELRPAYEFFISFSYSIYCIAILVLWRRGADSLRNAKFDSIRALRLWMLGAASLLGIMVIIDTMIAVRFAHQQLENALALISNASLISVVILFGGLMFIFFASQEKRALKHPTKTTDDVNEKALEVERLTRNLLEKNQLYLDPNLSLERLAKRLHLPTRSVSEAINQSQGMNVSQYVNGFRLQKAASLLVTTALSVNQILEQSGFLTRSNFYREFERVFRMSPTEYRSHNKR